MADNQRTRVPDVSGYWLPDFCHLHNILFPVDIDPDLLLENIPGKLDGRASLTWLARRV